MNRRLFFSVQKKMSNYHPDRSRVSAATLADFIRAPITGNLNEVPGIGQKTVEALNKDGISTTFQLMGRYLSLKDEGVLPIEHADRFYYWLTSLHTPAGFRAGIVRSIAEKLNITFPGLYDPAGYEAEEMDV